MKRVVLPGLLIFLLLAAAVPVRAEEVTGQMLVLDLDNKGFKPKKKPPMAYWDIDNDGLAEKCNWVRAGDGILVLDRDGDGIITDSSETFGGVDRNAFYDLGLLDVDNNRMVTPGDRVNYDRLRVWMDINGDGRSAKEELFTLGDLRITGFRVDAEPPAGREKLWLATFRRQTGKRLLWQTSAAYPLRCDDADTVPLPALPLDEAELAKLPDLPRAGALPSLHKGMAEDRIGSQSLLAVVRLLARMSVVELFAPELRLEDRVNDILYRRLGPDSRKLMRQHDHIDGRRLALLENMAGEKNAAAIDFWRAYGIERRYEEYYTVMSAQLLLQMAAAEIFTGPRVSYDPATGTLTGVTGLNHVVLRSLRDRMILTGSPEARRQSWRAVARLVDYVIGFDLLSAEDRTALDMVIRESGYGEGLAPIVMDIAGLMPIEIAASNRGGLFTPPAVMQEALLGSVLDAARLYSGRDDVFINDTVTYALKKCCGHRSLTTSALKRADFFIADATVHENRPGAPMAWIRYDNVLYAEKEDDGYRYAITAYFRGDVLDWALARVTRVGEAAPTNRK